MAVVWISFAKGKQFQNQPFRPLFQRFEPLKEILKLRGSKNRDLQSVVMADKILPAVFLNGDWSHKTYAN